MARVSICIPTFNYAEFLRDALDSALSQTFTDLEIVVVDNASTDDTPLIVEEYRRRDPRVRSVRNPENVGAQRNLNRCIEVATGEYVNILCSDDLLEPHAIERLAAALDARRDVVIAGGGRVVVDRDLRRPMNVLAFAREAVTLAGPDAIRSCLMRGNRIGEPSAVLLRRREAARGFDTSYRQLIDLEMWFHMLQRGAFAYVPEPLCWFRQHSGSESSRNVEAFSFVPELRRLVEQYAPSPDFLLRHGWRLHFAFEIWMLHLAGMPTRRVHRGMAELYPLPMFYALLPSELVREVRDRLYARRVLQQLPRAPTRAEGRLPMGRPDSATR
jgi:glycosyltransferase involved in cell wall biosynthesis